MPVQAVEGHVQASCIAPGTTAVAIANQRRLAVLGEIAVRQCHVVGATHDVQGAVVARIAGQLVGCVAVADRDMVDPNVLRTRDRDTVRIGIGGVFRVHIPGCVKGDIADDNVACPRGEQVAVLASGDPRLEVRFIIARRGRAKLAANQQGGAGDARRAALSIIDADQRGVRRNTGRAAQFLVGEALVLFKGRVVGAHAQVDVAHDANNLWRQSRVVQGRDQLLAVEHGVDVLRRGIAATCNDNFLVRTAVALVAMPADVWRYVAFERQGAVGGIGGGELPGWQGRGGAVICGRVLAANQHRRAALARSVGAQLQRRGDTREGLGIKPAQLHGGAARRRYHRCKRF